MNRYRIIVKGVLKKDEEFLIVNKWVDDNIMQPFQWSFIDGEVEFGQSPDAAVLRRIEEQTGINAYIDRILYTWTFMIGDECNIGIAYLCKTDVDEVTLSDELNDYEWASAMQVKECMNNTRVVKDLERCNVL